MVVTRVERLTGARGRRVGYEPCHLTHSAHIAVRVRHYNALQYTLVQKPVACAYIYTVTQANELALFKEWGGVRIRMMLYVIAAGSTAGPCGTVYGDTHTTWSG